MLQDLFCEQVESTVNNSVCGMFSGSVSYDFRSFRFLKCQNPRPDSDFGNMPRLFRNEQKVTENPNISAGPIYNICGIPSLYHFYWAGAQCKVLIG